jgi:outer membrane immunogenic protein
MKTSVAVATLATALLAAPSALAADIPVRPPVTKTPVTAPYDWTGGYIGLQGGYGWGKTRMTDTAGVTTGRFSVDGWFLGGTLGYNVQSGPWVWGVEGDLSWSGIDGRFTATCMPGGCESDLRWFGTARLRAGYTITPTTLAYLTGGAAYGNFRHKMNHIPSSRSASKWGWTLGGGVETFFTGNWTAKLEYQYLDFGRTLACGPALCLFPTDSDFFRTHIVRAGLNYRF